MIKKKKEKKEISAMVSLVVLGTGAAGCLSEDWRSPSWQHTTVLETCGRGRTWGTGTKSLPTATNPKRRLPEAFASPPGRELGPVGISVRRPLGLGFWFPLAPLLPPGNPPWPPLPARVPAGQIRTERLVKSLPGAAGQQPGVE